MASKSADQATTPLQRVRLEAGWKQSRVVAALVTEAQRRKIRIAAPASLKTMLSRWENGGGQPDEIYQGLFAAIYQCDEIDLGFRDHIGVPSVGASRLAPALDSETVDYFRSVFDQHVRADNLMGPHHLVEVVRAQAELLDEVLPSADPSTLADLLLLACRYNEFAGWLYQDAGDPTSAMTLSDRAMDYAMAIGDPTNSAYLLMRKANIASDLGSPVRALGLTAAALRDAGPISPRVRALVLGQQARAYAILGNADQCARSIDAATQSISEPGANADDVAEYCNPGYIAVQAATCSLDLNRPDEAVPVFEDALRGLPLTMRRDRGLCLTRLATAHAVRGDREEACNAGRQAITTVRSATSARALKELSRLREHLAPWRRDEEVSGLSHAIKGLTSAA